jgi:hypothetical protein
VNGTQTATGVRDIEKGEKAETAVIVTTTETERIDEGSDPMKMTWTLLSGLKRKGRMTTNL